MKGLHLYIEGSKMRWLTTKTVRQPQETQAREQLHQDANRRDEKDEMKIRKKEDRPEEDLPLPATIK